MRKAIAGLGVGIATPVFAVVVFYLWASQASLAPEDYAQGQLHTEARFDDHAPADILSIVTYNIGYASGRSNNSGHNASELEYAENLQRIVDALASVKPDLVAFQEIDFDSDRSYSVDQLRAIADALGLKYRVRAYNWDRRYLPFPYWPPSEHFGRILSGQAIASGFPVSSHRKVTLIKPAERPFYYNNFYLDRLVQVVSVDIGDTPVILLNVHLEAYMVATRERQVDAIADIVDQYRSQPLILLGDFNAQPPWLHSGRDDEGDPDTTLTRLIERTGLSKAIPRERYAEDAEKYFTFNSWKPFAALDHIFHNDRIEVISAGVLNEAGDGSDHLPVTMRFRIKPETNE